MLATGHGRSMALTERAVRSLPEPPDVLELDVTQDHDFRALMDAVAQRWDRVDGIVHSIAAAPPDALDGGFLTAPAASAELAFRTSAFSFKELTVALLPLCKGGASVVGIDFDGSVAWPGYDWMGVSKAALEAVSRYLARDLGPRGVRVNLVSAGPIRSPAASAFSGFSGMADRWAEAAPLGWDPRDASAVAEPICFLLSDHSRGITGEIIHSDGGVHAVRDV